MQDGRTWRGGDVIRHPTHSPTQWDDGFSVYN